MVSIICKKVQFQFLVRLMLLGIEDPVEPAVLFFVEKGNKTVLMVSIICKTFTFGTFLFSAHTFCRRSTAKQKKHKLWMFCTVD